MSSTLPESEASPEVVPLRHWGRLVGALVTLVGVAMLVHTIFSKIPSRTGKTICHLVKGVKSCRPALEWRFSWNIVGFAIAYLYPTITVGIPFGPWSFLNINSVTLFTPLIAAITALGLNEAAYFSEIARAGLISVDEGQIEAATSIGMTPSQTMRMVILPQAMRVIIPPTGNEVISMLKTTSLAATIGVIELTGAVSEISATNFKTMPLLLVACVWYLLCTTILSIGQFYVERYFARGSLRTQPPTPIQRLRQDLKGFGAKRRKSAAVA